MAFEEHNQEFALELIKKLSLLPVDLQESILMPEGRTSSFLHTAFELDWKDVTRELISQSPSYHRSVLEDFYSDKGGRQENIVALLASQFEGKEDYTDLAITVFDKIVEYPRNIQELICSSDNGQTSVLTNACEIQNKKLASRILKQLPGLTKKCLEGLLSQNEEGDNPLRICIYNEWGSEAQAIIDHLPNLSNRTQELLLQESEYGSTALRTAIHSGQSKQAIGLIRKAPDLKLGALEQLFSASDPDKNPLRGAIFSHEYKIAQEILDVAPLLPLSIQRVLFSHGSDGKSSLDLSILAASEKMTFALLDCCEKLPQQILTHLLTQPGEISDTFEGASDTFKTVLSQRNPRITKQLLQAVRTLPLSLQKKFFIPSGAGVNPLLQVDNHYRSTHLPVIAKELPNYHPRIQEALTAPDRDGRTILHHASRKNDIKGVNAIMANLEDLSPLAAKNLLSSADKRDRSVLHQLSKDKMKAPVKKLLKNFKDYPPAFQSVLMRPDFRGETVFHHLCNNAWTKEATSLPFNDLDPEIIKGFFSEDARGLSPILHIPEEYYQTEDTANPLSIHIKYSMFVGDVIHKLSPCKFNEVVELLPPEIKEACLKLASKKQLKELSPVLQEWLDQVKLDNSFSVDLEHMHKGVHYESEIPPPPHISIHRLKDMFDEIQFDNPQEPNYVNPNGLRDDTESITPEEMNSGLNTFLYNIDRQIPFSGTPSARDQVALGEFYDKLTKVLKHITFELKNMSPEDRRVHLMELAVAGKHCAGRYVSETQYLYNLLKNRGKGSDAAIEVHQVDNKVYKSLSDLRLERVQEMMLQVLGRHFADAHTYTAFMKLIGKDLGISGAEISDYDDPYTHLDMDKREALEMFFSKYTPTHIIDHVEDFVNNTLMSNQETRDVVIDFLKENCPSEYDDPVEYLGDAYKEDYKGLKREAIAHMLNCMDVLSPKKAKGKKRWSPFSR